MRIGNVGMSNSDFLKSQLPCLDIHFLLLLLKLHKLQSFMTLVHVQFKNIHTTIYIHIPILCHIIPLNIIELNFKTVKLCRVL